MTPMPDSPIQTAPAGSELDDRVALVMGWTLTNALSYTYDEIAARSCSTEDDENCREWSSGIRRKDWHPLPRLARRGAGDSSYARRRLDVLSK